MEKHGFIWKWLIALLINLLKKKKRRREITLYHPKLYSWLHFAPSTFGMHVLHPKIRILVTLCTPTLSLLLTLMEKYNTIWKYLIFSLLNPLKTKDKLYVTIINYTPNYILYPKLWIFIQVNSKLNVGVQSVTRVIV